MQYLIGIDIGTTNVKAVAIAEDNRVLATASRPTQFLSPFPGAAEQSPLDLLRQVATVVRTVQRSAATQGQAAGLIFSGAMHSLILMDADNEPLSNAWLWSDLRAAGTGKAFRQTAAGTAVYQRTGTPLHAMSPLVKIMWLRQHQPDLMARTWRFMGIKDFILQKIVQENITDASIASATGLLNTRSGQWDELALEMAGIRKEQLPEPVSPLSVFPLPKRAAAWLRLPAGLPVIPGASDGALANLGSGALGPDTLGITVGTSAALRVTLPAPSLDPEGRTFCYRVDDSRFVAGGASNNGSNVMDWLHQNLLQSRKSMAALLHPALALPAGSEGLMLVPYLHGERAPVWDAEATGVLQGLSARHTQAHMLRAAVEGVVLNLRLVASLLPAGQNALHIALSGGAAGSPLWRSVVADVFQLPVRCPAGDSVDLSARGAILMARAALGWPDLPAQAQVETTLPNQKNAAVYHQALTRFIHLCGHSIRPASDASTGQPEPI